MLIGQYETKLGEKHQAGLPKRFREILGDKLIVTKGFEQCLIIVSEANWKTLLEGTGGKPFTTKATRDLQRFLLGNASYVTLDSKGRFVIPDYLRKFAFLDTDIVFGGMERYIEVWSKKNWEENQKMLSENIESIAERLVKEE